MAYEQRLARFGAQIEAAIDTPSEEAIRRCERLQAEIADHRLAKLGRTRGADFPDRDGAAARPLAGSSAPHRRRHSPSSPTSTGKELAFVDWARESICRGEDVPDLSKAYQQLDQGGPGTPGGVQPALRQSRWPTGPPSGSSSRTSCGVEDVLPQVVAKVAEADNRVLLIVLDGMSWAVCHELLDDIRQEHWFEATLDESSAPPPPVIATVPSVTHFSRASLLSGKLEKGDSSVEKRNFEANPHLKQSATRGIPRCCSTRRKSPKGPEGSSATI